MDPHHPIRVGSFYYPPLSLKNGEQGASIVRIEVDSTGFVRATQLILSTGFDRLDDASLIAFDDGQVLPAEVAGKPITTWVNVPIAWQIADGPTITLPQSPPEDQLPVPTIRKGYALPVAATSYPPSARAAHEEGICTVHIKVARTGQLKRATLTNSTRSAALDAACLTVIKNAPFNPAHHAGGAYAGEADINVFWRLDDLDSAPADGSQPKR